MTDAKGADEIETVAVPDGANVPATYGGVVVKASPTRPTPRPSSSGSPARTARPCSRTPGSCRRAMTSDLAAGRCARRPGRARGARAGSGGRSTPSPSRSALVPRAAGLRARRAGDPRRPLLEPRRLAVVADALALSLATTAISLVADGRVRAPRSRSLLARRRFRGQCSSRPSSTCRSCCRRRSPGSRCCSSSADAGSSASRCGARASRSRSRRSRS